MSMSYRNIEINGNAIKMMCNILVLFYKIYSVKRLDIYNVKLLKILTINIVIYFRI